MARFMSKRLLVAAAVVVVVLGGGAAVYASTALQRQPEPEKGSFSSQFVEQYVAEKLETPENETVPVFRHEDILSADGGLAVGFDHGFWKSFSFRADLFEQIVTRFPDPLIRDSGEYLYAVYDTTDGVRLFAFFSKEKHKGMFVDGYPVAMIKTLSYADFAGVEIGDSWQEVAAIDPVVNLYIPRFDEQTDAVLTQNENMGMRLTSIHLLSDGVLRIEYTRTVDDTYVIGDMLHSPDFVLEGADGATYYKILDADYLGVREQQ